MNTTETRTSAPWEELDSDLVDSMVSVVPPEEEAAIEEALELQMISIRLQKSLITQLKVIADFHEVGYQPLIRDLLNRFVRSELQIILGEMIKQKKEQLQKLQEDTGSESQSNIPAIDDFLAREAKRAA
jgi:predicted DNA binding CopG/RHH family protein